MNSHRMIWNRLDRTVLLILSFWMLVISDDCDAQQPRHPNNPTRIGTAEELSPEGASVDQLRTKWRSFFASPRVASRSSRLVVPADERLLLPPKQRGLALRSTNSFLEPEVKRSVDGVLRQVLDVTMAGNRIGDDPVYLRSYNGHLVGPTLRVTPGDSMKILLINTLPPETDTGEHNQLHGFNTTNLHTHGLHVSPAGNSDNVLLEIGPGQSKELQIDIPADHPAGTFWYHAHKHGSVAAQVGSGMTGAIIVEGGQDQISEIAAARERVFVLQQIPYYNKNLPEGVIELRYAGDLFGPNDWDALGRYTTVNGVTLPVIRMRPGEVERWRLVNSAFRERIDLKVEKDDGSSVLTLHEIAVDGLPLGKVVPRNLVELWPGYRSDVLIKAPDQPGEYLLVDERVAAGGGLNGQPEDRKYIGRLIIEGTPNPQTLPRSQDLTSFRLPSVRDDELTGSQTVTYGINVPPLRFEIDGRSFDPTHVRSLKLGAVEEWTARSVNNVGAVDHPFHIHVNPFEVVSIKDAQNNELLDEPVWRDTVILRANQTVTFRTRYQRFTGDFVQHCHILDHEDQGMMELVRITATETDPGNSPASVTPKRLVPATPPRTNRLRQTPDAALTDPQGRARSLEEFRGRTTVLVLVKGFDCPHCVEQLATFAKAIQNQGRMVVAISPKSDDTGLAAKSSVPVLFDLKYAVFQQFGCYQDGPRHGVVILDPRGAEVWKTVGDEPFLDTEAVLRESRRAVSQIELEIGNTASLKDDYVTWAPMSARIRLVPGASITTDLPVVLTNDAPTSPASNGDIVFDHSVTDGATATQETLALTLPAKCNWVPFVVAGKFGRPSFHDKDAVIEVHEGASTGLVIGSQALMVRVRKDVRALTTDERTELLKAFDDLHVNQKRFEWFLRLHNLAAIHPAWPDNAHKFAGFLPWHRAFLLQLERELQKNFPHVTLPYWVQDEATEDALFHADFFGINVKPDGTFQQPVILAATNPLYGWYIEFQSDGANSMGELARRSSDHRVLPTTPAFKSWETHKLAENYADLRANVEANPHNNGHGFVGPPGRWMSNCRESPADPAFWVFHCHHDRLWAKWQHWHDRFATDGSDPKHYAPEKKYAKGDTVPFGHHLPDTMWPWDGTKGVQIPDDPGSVRPDVNDFGAFPASPNLWPASDAAPTPADMLDYLGLDTSRLGHGVCYDDVPFGRRSEARLLQLVEAPERQAARSVTQFSLEILTDAQAAPRMRSQAARHIVTHELRRIPDASRKLTTVARDRGIGVEIREQALGLLAQVDAEAAAKVSVETIANPDSPVSLSLQSIQTIGQLMHFEPVSARLLADSHRELLKVARDDQRGPVRSAAIQELAGMNDADAGDLLAGFLTNPASSPLSEVEIVRSLHGFEKHRPLVCQRLQARRPEVVIEALRVLTPDTDSQPDRRTILTDKSHVTDVRIAAIRSLMRHSIAALDNLMEVLRDPENPVALRAEAGAAVRVVLRRQGKNITAQQREKLCAVLLQLQPSLAPGETLDRVVQMALDQLSRSVNP